VNESAKAKEQFEDEAIGRFVAFLRESQGHDYRVAAREVPAGNGKNFDRLLVAPSGDAPPIAVEIFRVAKEEELESTSLLAQLQKEIRGAAQSRGIIDIDVRTPFLITPRNLKREAENLMAQVEALLACGERRFAVGGTEIEVRPGQGFIGFSTHVLVGTADPLGVATASFVKELPYKDLQLPAAFDGERVVLAVNVARFLDVSEAVQAMASIDTSSLVNIDQVVFATGARHRSIYLRSVREALAERGMPPADEAAADLLEEYLQVRLQRKDSATFEWVRTRGSTLWMRNPRTREAVLQRAADLADDGDIDSAMWAIREMVGDPDPSPCSSSDPDGVFNFHQKIQAGDHVPYIVSVRGWAAWTLHKVICRAAPDLREEVIGFAEQLILDANLYVRRNAGLLVWQLAVLRMWRDDAGNFVLGEDLRDRIKRVALQMFTENAHLPRVLDWASNAACCLVDLGETDSNALLDVLLAYPDREILGNAVDLLIFLAVERARRIPPFDADAFQGRLESCIAEGSTEVRREIARQIYVAVKTAPAETARLAQYVSALASGPYESGVRHFFYKIFVIWPPETSARFDQLLLESITASVGAQDPFAVMYEMLPVFRMLAECARWETLAKAMEMIAEPRLRGAFPELVRLIVDAPPGVFGPYTRARLVFGSTP
jgi:hypothetical protein